MSENDGRLIHELKKDKMQQKFELSMVDDEISNFLKGFQSADIACEYPIRLQIAKSLKEIFSFLNKLPISTPIFNIASNNLYE